MARRYNGRLERGRDKPIETWKKYCKRAASSNGIPYIKFGSDIYSWSRRSKVYCSPGIFDVDWYVLGRICQNKVDKYNYFDTSHKAIFPFYDRDPGRWSKHPMIYDLVSDQHYTTIRVGRRVIPSFLGYFTPFDTVIVQGPEQKAREYIKTHVAGQHTYGTSHRGNVKIFSALHNIEEMPVEIIYAILAYCCSKDIKRFCCTCQAFSVFFADEYFCKMLINLIHDENGYDVVMVPPESYTRMWKKACWIGDIRCSYLKADNRIYTPDFRHELYVSCDGYERVLVHTKYSNGVVTIGNPLDRSEFHFLRELYDSHTATADISGHYTTGFNRTCVNYWSIDLKDVKHVIGKKFGIRYGMMVMYVDISRLLPATGRKIEKILEKCAFAFVDHDHIFTFGHIRKPTA